MQKIIYFLKIIIIFDVLAVQKVDKREDSGIIIMWKILI